MSTGQKSICKICGSNKMLKFLSLGPTPLANSFLAPDRINSEEVYYPLDVYYCNDCHFVQLGYVVDPTVMFSNYIYVSSTSMTLGQQLGDFAAAADRRLDENSFVVEMASNDGTLLKNLMQRHTVLGVDPAKNIAVIARESGIPTMEAFFNVQTARQILNEHGRADAILGANVFAHVSDLNGLIEAVKLLLAENGFASFESPHFVDLYTKMEFDTIYHEHIYYLTMHAIEHLCCRHDMELFDVHKTDMHGGAIRFFIQRSNGPRRIEPSVAGLMAAEKKLGLDKPDTYNDFAAQVLHLKIELLTMLSNLKKNGMRLAAYGAPAKGNTLLNYFSIGNDLLEYIVDKSELKQGTFSPGKRIPVVGLEKLDQDPPDYLVILAWNYAREIMQQLEGYGRRGGKFIIPIPAPKIV